MTATRSSAMTCAARSMAPAFSKSFDAVAMARSSSGVRFAMRAQRLGRGGEVPALLLVQRRELLLERDLLLDVGLAGVASCSRRFARSSQRWRLLEQARERLPRALVAAVDREELLPGVDRAVDVAEVALAEAGDLAEPLLARLDRLAGHPQRREEHVAERSVLALGAQVVLDPRERLGVRGVDLEHLAVLLVGLALLPLLASICAASRSALEPVGGRRRARRIPPLLPRRLAEAGRAAEAAPPASAAPSCS